MRLPAERHEKALAQEVTELIEREPTEEERKPITDHWITEVVSVEDDLTRRFRHVKLRAQCGEVIDIVISRKLLAELAE